MGRNPKNNEVPLDDPEAPSLPEAAKADTKDSTMTTIEISVVRNDTVIKNENDVLFRIKYSDGYSGKKLFKDGDETVMSKETAELFNKRGMGDIVKSKK